MKKQTIKQKMGDYFDAFYAIKNGGNVKRSRAKDGSIPTHPVVECAKVPEATVLKECLAWLRVYRIVCNRNNTGFGDIHNTGQKYTYGIPGAGDIMGLLRTGLHFEIECKAGKGGRLSKNQQQRWRDIQESNGLYLVIHGIEELEYYKELIL